MVMKLSARYFYGSALRDTVRFSRGRDCIYLKINILKMINKQMYIYT